MMHKRLQPFACLNSGFYHLIRIRAKAPSRPAELQDGAGCSQVMERAGSTLGWGCEALLICNLVN